MSVDSSSTSLRDDACSMQRLLVGGSGQRMESAANGDTPLAEASGFLGGGSAEVAHLGFVECEETDRHGVLQDRQTQAGQLLANGFGQGLDLAGCGGRSPEAVDGDGEVGLARGDSPGDRRSHAVNPELQPHERQRRVRCIARFKQRGAGGEGRTAVLDQGFEEIGGGEHHKESKRSRGEWSGG